MTSKLWVLLLLLVPVSLAQVYISGVTEFGLDNGAYITINPPQNVTNITVYNSTSVPASTLQMYLNNSLIRYTTATNKTLWNLSQNNLTDIYTFNGTGTDSYLNFSVKMLNTSSNYSLHVDGIATLNNTSDTSGTVNFNYSWTGSTHIFLVQPSGNATVVPVNNTPEITAWFNDINGWNQTTATLNAGNQMTFNVTVNMSVDTISWKVQGSEEQNTGSLQFTRWFNSTGSFNVTAEALSNTNGSSNIVYTVVTVTGSGGGGTNYDWLDGYVTNTTGPVVDAWVNTTLGNTQTGSSGYYSFGYIFIDGSSYWINASSPGNYDNNTFLLFDEDQERLNITLSELPVAQTTWNMSGYVTNTSGGFIQAATITYSGGSNTTDSNGYWQITGISNGTYNFTASRLGYDDNITSISMNGADLTDQNFTLSLASTYTLSGYVQDYNGTYLQNVNISYLSGSNITNNTGYYYIDNILAGTHTFTSYLYGYGNISKSISVSSNQTVNWSLQTNDELALSKLDQVLLNQAATDRRVDSLWGLAVITALLSSIFTLVFISFIGKKRNNTGGSRGSR